MPIDPSIPLSVRPMQVPDPLQSYGRAISLQNLMQSNKMNQVRMRELELREQERQQNLKDQQALRDAYIGYPTDMNKLKTAYFQKGGSPMLWQKFHKGNQDQLQQDLQVDEAKRKQDADKVDRFLGGINDIETAPEDQQPTVFSTIRGRFIGEGLAKEEDFPAELPDPNQLRLLKAGLLHRSQQLKEADASRAAAGERRAVTEAEHKAQLFPTQKTEAESKAFEASINRAVKELRSMKTAKDYDAILKKQMPDIRAILPRTEEWDLEKTPKQLDDIAMSAYQRAQVAGRNTATRPIPMSTDQGTYLVSPITGESIEAKTPAGQPIKKSTAGGEGSTAQQGLNAQAEIAKRKELQEIEAAEYGGFNSQGEPLIGLHEDRAHVGTILRTGKETNEQGAEIAVMSSNLARYRSRFEWLSKSLRLKIQRKYELGAITQDQRDQYLTEIDNGTRQALGNAAVKKSTPSVPSRPTAAPAPASPAEIRKPLAESGAKKWTVKGVTYTEGQQIIGPDGNKYRVTNVVNGKIQAEPL